MVFIQKTFPGYIVSTYLKIWLFVSKVTIIQAANNYLLKVNSKNNRKWCEACISHISQLFLVFVYFELVIVFWKFCGIFCYLLNKQYSYHIEPVNWMALQNNRMNDFLTTLVVRLNYESLCPCWCQKLLLTSGASQNNGNTPVKFTPIIWENSNKNCNFSLTSQAERLHLY